MISVVQGDCVEVLRARDGPLFDSCVTDPPYELGFMGREWDKSGVAFQVATWRAVFDQLRPGAHLFAFGGTRTYHRLAVAIEDAGFEIRDQFAWAYGSGFPKNHDISKAIDDQADAEREVVRPYGQGFRAAGSGLDGWQREVHAVDKGVTATDAARQWEGWGTAVKPAYEPICLARKPLDRDTIAANVLAHGTGGLNIDACRVSTDETIVATRNVALGSSGASVYEQSPLGRWPANLAHDGSVEVVSCFPDASGKLAPVSTRPGAKTGDVYGRMTREGEASAARRYAKQGGTDFTLLPGQRRLDTGSAARFFYSAKAGPLDRLGSEHPTVKPVDLKRWLARMITPPGGLLLDPFAGSGTTGIAAMAEGFDAELIELLADHVADIERKLAALRGDGARVMERHIKRKASRTKRLPSPLFGDLA